MPVSSAMMKAAEPITGGRMLPPVDAATSTPPAREARYPSRRIIGIVIDPVVTTSAVGLPDMVPNSAEDTTATLAGPPGVRPASAAEMLKKNAPPPAFSRNVPNITNRKA
jgi:hypothetical protein